KAGSWLLLINRIDVLLDGMESRGCAHLNVMAAQFSFDPLWTHEEVDTYLRETVFPIPFRYVDSKEKGKHKPGESPPCQWQLINKEKGKYEMVYKDYPKGSHLMFYRGRDKCRTADADVIIGESYGNQSWMLQAESCYL
ncbi:hypothetical protein BV22DRAFT_1022247, partial [Leucogyrophana mollusca]